MCSRESWAAVVAQRSSVAPRLRGAAGAALLPLCPQQDAIPRSWGCFGLQESWDLA